MKVAPTREGIRSEGRLESKITRLVLPWREGKEIPSEALPEEVILGVDSMEKMNRPCGAVIPVASAGSPHWIFTRKSGVSSATV
jgi:hypothetical protein